MPRRLSTTEKILIIDKSVKFGFQWFHPQAKERIPCKVSENLYVMYLEPENSIEEYYNKAVSELRNQSVTLDYVIVLGE